MLLFLDGMAHYPTAGIDAKWTVRDNAQVVWSIVPEGRFGGSCLKRVSTNNYSQSGFLGFTPFNTRSGLWTAQSGGVCGYAMKIDDLSKVSDLNASNYAYGLLAIEETSMSSPINAGPWHLRVELQPNGTFTLYGRSGGGNFTDKVLATSVEAVTSATWMFVEFKWLIDHTVGRFEIRVNGITVLTYSGDTRVSDATNFGVWNSIRVFSADSVPGDDTHPYLTMRFSDFYLADLTAPLADDVHDFLGDGVIVTIRPNAPGDASGWTTGPTAGGANWDMVNDKPVSDDDATYVTTLTPGVSDLYHFEDLPAGVIVKAAHLNILARKETDGAAAVAPLVQPPGSGPLTGPTQGVANVLYDHYLTQPYDLNPATGVRFTAADINTGQFGMTKVT